ncbi:hypothetical protein [Oceanobacillus senegalensis]|uniref:hypothetical protein n=1 Tax=Oceanobacillus senegalensis TaxID=1936063 RepID=UPI000A30537F|nr:hypothetical protein [Oceanobacillus senegalensis]
MVESVLTAGGVLGFISFILSLMLVKVTPKDKYVAYYHAVFLGIVGILLVLTSSLVDIHFMGIPLGGLGIVCMFSAAIGFIFSSIFDAYQQANA